MTQQELDIIMQQNINIKEDDGQEKSKINNSSLKYPRNEPLGYSKDTAHYWPYPATDENKMVYQLDDVTKESEEKASEIFDIIDTINTALVETEERSNKVIEVLNSNIKLFTTLNTKFPNVITFKTKLEKNNYALKNANIVVEILQSSSNSIIDVMDIMQYQDIHRQKIERVINVMRSLSNYMNNLLEGRIDDGKRVSSAQHIVGDTHNKLVSNKDIETLLKQFGNKK